MNSDPIYEYVSTGFRKAAAKRAGGERRIGSELKFPMVDLGGRAVRPEKVDALWRYLGECGWTPVEDGLTGKVVGATKPGEQNDSVASCETGYCKAEFSLAHAADLNVLEEAIEELREELRPFSEREGVRFLGYGIQPISRPGEHLMMKKSRTSVWDRVFKSNRHVPEEDGDDLHLFTINAASHVHISVAEHEAIPLINVLNGFSGAQIALTADSSVWRGEVDPEFKCVAEKFWDWWIPDGRRVGVPEKPFDNLRDYVETIASFPPVYIKRDGMPITLEQYETFRAHYEAGVRVEEDIRGTVHEVTPEPADIDLHSTCYWYNTRLSRYYTVENRTNDQQPPDALLCIPALTLGLASALSEAQEELAPHDWQTLQAGREAACRDALRGRANGLDLSVFAGRLLDVAETGLRRRGLGEERFLESLKVRVAEQRCPAEDAAETFSAHGIDKLIANRSI